MSTIDNIDQLYGIYENILKAYTELDKLNQVLIWTKIATIIHQNESIFVKIYRKLRHDPTRKEIKIPYNDKIPDLNTQIKSESNLLIKLSLILGVLHQIIYNLLTLDGNYKLILDGQTEMVVLKKKITYYISISDKPDKNIFFHAFILLIALESLFNTHFYVGIDFEYTGIDPVHKRKKIQLAQINFEHNTDPRSIIMIVSPDALNLEPIQMKNFIRLIMCNGHIKKILHGSDALDIPYIYGEMLENDPTKIIKFTRGLIDTKLLCEYYKLNLEKPSDSVCKMYTVLEYFHIISPDKNSELELMIEELGPHQDLRWDNIQKMPKHQLLYALYDVIYLKYFYYQILVSATLETTDPLKKKTIMTLYKHVLYELTQFAYLEKNKITFVEAKCKEEIDPINNFMIRHKIGTPSQKILKLIDVYNLVNQNLITADPVTNIDSILKVNYFKGIITTILKKMVYTIASRNFTIYKDKNTTWPTKLDNLYVFEFFDKMNYKYLNRMFKDLESTLGIRLKMLFDSKS